MKTIKQIHIIKASPPEVFAALTHPVTIELWSGYPAEMEAIAGTEFSLWEGEINGRNIEINPPERLVQEWYIEGQAESSLVTIELKPHKKGTQVLLEHSLLPDDQADEFDQGWKEYYWGAIRDFFS